MWHAWERRGKFTGSRQNEKDHLEVQGVDGWGHNGS
jgi:hypothetical protein